MCFVYFIGSCGALSSALGVSLWAESVFGVCVRVSLYVSMSLCVSFSLCLRLISHVIPNILLCPFMSVCSKTSPCYWLFYTIMDSGPLTPLKRLSGATSGQQLQTQKARLNKCLTFLHILAFFIAQICHPKCSLEPECLQINPSTHMFWSTKALPYKRYIHLYLCNHRFHLDFKGGTGLWHW